MDVLLIAPQTAAMSRVRSAPMGYSTPMGLLYLAKPLLEQGFHVDILDLTAYQLSLDRLCAYVKTYSPAVVGITCMTGSYSQAIQIAQTVKVANVGARVIMGGPHVTFQARQTLENENIDVVVRGEGDVNFAQLVAYYILRQNSLDQIDGISYRENGTVVENPAVRIQDIDQLGYPPRNILNLHRYRHPGVIHYSRGCPFQCQFCAAGAMAGGKYRFRSVASILEEIDYLVSTLGITSLGFSDDTVTARPKQMKRICRQILKKGYALQWTCESRVDVADRSLLKLMAQSGCRSIFFGFESGNPEILKSINKRITPAQMEKAVRRCLDVGITPWGAFIIGFPHDTQETIAETFEFATKIKRWGAMCSFGVLTPFPGTYIYDHADEIGITIHSENWDDFETSNPIISTPHLSLEELKGIFSDIRRAFGMPA